MTAISEPATATVDQALSYQQICGFLYQEARFQDEHRYDDWEALWTDDALYWVPANADDADPETRLSIIYDNRARIGTRIRQLKSGSRFAQTPRSALRRMISNVEILGRDGDEVTVEANVLVAEWRLGESRTWAGRVAYLLRLDGDGQLKMARKKVMLINLAQEIPTLAFLI